MSEPENVVRLPFSRTNAYVQINKLTDDVQKIAKETQRRTQSAEKRLNILDEKVTKKFDADGEAETNVLAKIEENHTHTCAELSALREEIYALKALKSDIDDGLQQQVASILDAVDTIRKEKTAEMNHQLQLQVLSMNEIKKENSIITMKLEKLKEETRCVRLNQSDIRHGVKEHLSGIRNHVEALEIQVLSIDLEPLQRDIKELQLQCEGDRIRPEEIIKQEQSYIRDKIKGMQDKMNTFSSVLDQQKMTRGMNDLKLTLSNLQKDFRDYSVFHDTLREETLRAVNGDHIVDSYPTEEINSSRASSHSSREERTPWGQTGSTKEEKLEKVLQRWHGNSSNSSTISRPVKQNRRRFGTFTEKQMLRAQQMAEKAFEDYEYRK